MNKNDLIKWLLIAGAAYMVYRYLQAQGALGKPTAVAQAEGVVKPAIEEPPPPPADFVSLKRDQLHQYAASRMPASWDGRLTISEWNWMTSQLTGKEQQATLPGGDNPIYAEEYLALRKGAGISGLQRAFGSYAMESGWSM